MSHQMKLNQGPFEKILSGAKTIEVRLFDEKRQLLNPGDTITFSKLPEQTEKLTVQITGLYRYSTFKDLCNEHPLSSFGYTEEYDKKTFIDSFYTIYSPTEEQKYGVLGIGIKLI